MREPRRRFGDLPSETIAVIESTPDPERLNGWLDRLATAGRLEDVGIE